MAPVPAPPEPTHKEYPREPAAVEEEQEQPAPGRKDGARGQLAVIIDDMGNSMQEARALAGIGLPVTFSIIPGLRHDRDVADFAAQGGIETMIHIPMQSKGWPQRRLEANGLLLAMDDAAIREHMGDYALRIPRAHGVNNHMGSEFTEHEDKMRTVLEVLKGRGLFFVDSVTTPKTVGLRLAREMGVKTAKRNVFLDNEQDGAYIRGQLAQAVRLARKNGSAIAICHPHPATIATLAEALPTLAGQGITLVPVSRLVR
ncbi:divergent polysaccharide deacetylase family protein [Geobacter sp. FeAm09]|uniref:divergent polysaccharide deacetylase family protein n=1 Tax=Geobacter sp. FeAm09 TaxID=2597769 RepID=UPI001F0D84E2|nr:divergent polysaccharide deacetylase family protein [Geobacter sp. FeAm09]